MRYPLATSVVPSRRPGRTDRDRGPGAVGFSRSRVLDRYYRNDRFPSLTCERRREHLDPQRLDAAVG
jgi:hypothetical protein